MQRLELLSTIRLVTISSIAGHTVEISTLTGGQGRKLLGLPVRVNCESYVDALDAVVLAQSVVRELQAANGSGTQEHAAALVRAESSLSAAKAIAEAQANLCTENAQSNRVAREGGHTRGPYEAILDACLSPCGHNPDSAVRRDGSMAADACRCCNVYAVFYGLAVGVLPLVEASTQAELNIAASGDPRVAWTEQVHDERVKQWGNLVTHTFRGIGSGNTVTDYMHLLVDHSALLTRLQGK
jgi:hypothetical protein